MWIANRQAQEAYDNEIAALTQQHQTAMEEAHFRQPSPVEMQLLAEDAEPLEFGKIVVMPGMLYGQDDHGNEIAIHPTDIGPGEFWEKVPAP